MVARGGNLTPKQWIWYWRIGMVVLGPACAVGGLVTGELGLAVLGVAIEAIGLAMLVFWRRMAQRPPLNPPDSS